MAAYLSVGWLRGASANVPTRVRGPSRQLLRIVSLVFLSIPLVVLIFCLKISSYNSFGPVATASAFALVMSLWAWELIVPPRGRDVSAGRDPGRNHSTRIVIADALRASKLAVLVIMPALTIFSLWNSQDAGLFYLVGWASEWVVSTSSWWIVVFPVACLLLLAVSAYVVIDALEGSVRGRSDVSRAGPGPATHVEG
jgi:hypothetical protein